MKHWYSHAFISYCGIDITNENVIDYTGLASIDECECIKCIQSFLKKADNIHYLNLIEIAEKRLNELTYISEFDKLINEDKK